MRVLTIMTLSLLFALNAAWMLASPASWYATVPGVAESGPLNTHFVRDVAMAYAVCAGGLLWMLANDGAWPASMAGAAFLALHALIHVAEYFEGLPPLARIVADVVLIYSPPVLVFMLASSTRRRYKNQKERPRYEAGV
jgi:hypothetical protein